MPIDTKPVAWMKFDQLKVISRDEMMTFLLAVCPSFQAPWEALVKEWSDEPELPLYTVLSDLARHLIALLENKETDVLKAVFIVVETWIQHGDEYVSNAAVVGLLEGIQNSGLHHTTTPEDFRPFLGPLALQAWKDLYDFWEGRQPPG